MRKISRYLSQAVVIMFLPALAFAHAGHHKAKPQEPIEIRVTEEGFVPATVAVPAGRPVTLVFRRSTEHTCATEAVFPALHKRVALPLNRPVRVTLRPRSNQTIEFACGMRMYSGKVVAQ